MSKVLPILFNTDMVRAILDGRKTVTRRCVKPKSKNACGFCVTFRKSDNAFMGVYDYDDNEMMFESSQTPPCQPGDILYVRESYCPDYFDEGIAGCRDDGLRGNRNAYKADYNKDIVGDVVPEPKWKPSIHMPKEAARIWLRVTDVRVERLQEITDEQAAREGIRAYTKDDKLFKYAVTDDWWIDYHKKHRKLFSGTFWQDMPKTAKEALSYLWDSTVKKPDLDCYGWEANPWVWVIEFERCGKMESHQ